MTQKPVTLSINPSPPLRADSGFPFWNPLKIQDPGIIAGGQRLDMIEDITVNRIPLRDEVNHSNIKRVPVPAAPVQRISDAAKLQAPIPQVGRIGGNDLMSRLVADINKTRMQGGE